MATHDRPGVPIEEEHEYSFPMLPTPRESDADTLYSYEALPPNFSLTANMLAGAFAGIAVRSELAADVWTATNLTIGALGDVPRGSSEGMQLRHGPLIHPRRSADSAKTRIQIISPSPGAMYSGISNAMVTISRVEGFRTLWRGISSVIMGAGRSIKLQQPA
jgi:hypothetical protein